MDIVCKKCGYREKVTPSLFLKIIGGRAPQKGFRAWVDYIAAGTEFALPICIAIVLGNVDLNIFSDNIKSWMGKHYNCPKCGAKNWKTE